MSKDLIKQHALALKGLTNVPGPIDPNFFATMDQDAVKRLRRRFRDEDITEISTQNIHLLRDSTLILIDGVPYVKPFHMGTYVIPARRLTPQEITEALANELEMDRIYKVYKGETPWWEMGDKMSREEFMAKKQAKSDAFYATPRGQRIKKLEEELGRKSHFWDRWELDKRHATPEELQQMLWREKNDRDLGNAIPNPYAPPGFQVLDKHVNRVISIVITILTYVYYPAIIYSVVGFIGFLHFLGYLVAYRRIWISMRSPVFVYDPKSRFTEEYQRVIWEGDRERYLSKHKDAK